eukprot:245216-Pelagomonas_calceolata.AAC.10
MNQLLQARPCPHLYPPQTTQFPALLPLLPRQRSRMPQSRSVDCYTLAHTPLHSTTGKWVLPIFQNDGLKVAYSKYIPRRLTGDPCCQVCWSPVSKEGTRESHCYLLLLLPLQSPLSPVKDPQAASSPPIVTGRLPSHHVVLGEWDGAHDPVPHPIPLGPLPSPLAPHSLQDLRTSVGELSSCMSAGCE